MWFSFWLSLKTTKSLYQKKRKVMVQAARKGRLQALNNPLKRMDQTRPDRKKTIWHVGTCQASKSAPCLSTSDLQETPLMLIQKVMFETPKGERKEARFYD